MSSGGSGAPWSSETGSSTRDPLPRARRGGGHVTTPTGLVLLLPNWRVAQATAAFLARRQRLLLEDTLRGLLPSADCTRRQVAAVLVLDGRVVGSGANGLPVGSCTGGDCPRGRTSYDETPAFSDYAGNCDAVHAEVAAIVEAGPLADGAVCYTTCAPCRWCAEELAAAGVARTVVVDLGGSATPVSTPG